MAVTKSNSKSVSAGKSMKTKSAGKSMKTKSASKPKRTKSNKTDLVEKKVYGIYEMSEMGKEHPSTKIYSCGSTPSVALTAVVKHADKPRHFVVRKNGSMVGTEYSIHRKQFVGEEHGVFKFEFLPFGQSKILTGSANGVRKGNGKWKYTSGAPLKESERLMAQGKNDLAKDVLLIPASFTDSPIRTIKSETIVVAYPDEKYDFKESKGVTTVDKRGATAPLKRKKTVSTATSSSKKAKTTTSSGKAKSTAAGNAFAKAVSASKAKKKTASASKAKKTASASKAKKKTASASKAKKKTASASKSKKSASASKSKKTTSNKK